LWGFAKMGGDYTEEFKCLCGGYIDIYINWITGNETPRCRNNCELFNINWYCEIANKLNGGD